MLVSMNAPLKAPFEPNEGARLWRAVRAGAFVALAGPPVGSLLVVAPMTVRIVLAGEPSADPWWREFAAFVLLSGVFSYILGGLHALLCGLWLGRLVYLRGSFSNAEAVVTAIGASLLASLAFALLGAVGTIPLQVVAALFAALVCRWLLLRLGWIDRCSRTSVS